MFKLNSINKYHNAETVNKMCLFDDFNLTIEDQEFVSVVRGNGSGKASMLNLICGSIPLDNGSILINEENITNIPEYRYQRRIDRVYQNPAIRICLNVTVLENMSLTDNKGKSFNLRLGTSKQRIDYCRESLKTLGLGLGDRLHIKVGIPSGDRCQAMALLTSTMTPIEFLVLNEHTAALDPRAAEIIVRLTNKTIRERAPATVTVTRNLRYAVEHGSRLITVYQGHVIIDKAGEEKVMVEIDDILGKFNEISIECGN